MGKQSQQREPMSQYVLAIPSHIQGGGHQAQVASIPSAIDLDRELFDRHLSGDDSSFVGLFRRHNHRLYTYCLKMVGSSEAAEDLTQELWEKVIRLRLDPKPVKNPVGFLVTMARNLSLNHIKARKRLSPFDDLPESAHPFDSIRERTEMEELVVQALERLAFDYREVLILNSYSGYSLDEIATMLGKSPEAIWKRASRAREKLRNEVMSLMEQQQRLDSMTSNANGGRHD